MIEAVSVMKTPKYPKAFPFRLETGFAGLALNALLSASFARPEK